MIKKVLLIILIILLGSLCMWAGTHDPWDGTLWDVTSPDIDQPHGNSYKEIYDLRKGVAIRANKEHVTYATSSAGGEHLNGSAVANEGTTTPTKTVSGGSTALSDIARDRGRLWLDDNYDPPVLKRWDGSAWEVVGRYLVDSASLELYLHNAVQEDTDGGRESRIRAYGEQSGGERTTLGYIEFSHDGTSDDEKGKFLIKLNDGNDANAPSLTPIAIGSDQLVELPGALTIGGVLTGGASSNIAINTDKFTVAADTGNTAVAGTLGVTGVATLGDTSALATSGAPTADAQIANKKYVDDQIDTRKLVQGISNLDSESNAMLPGHAYLAQVDGFVSAEAYVYLSEYLRGYIHSTNDPAGAGTRVGRQETTASGFAKWVTIYFAVPAGWYFEITSNGDNVAIRWQSKGSDSKPIDQD